MKCQFYNVKISHLKAEQQYFGKNAIVDSVQFTTDALDCINSCFSTWGLHYLVLEKIMDDLFFCLKAIK